MPIDWLEQTRARSFLRSSDGQKYQRVALQFPDTLLEHAASCAEDLQDLFAKEETARTCFILGDTSYGSCCVDETAAQHADADLILHYGATCLSKSFFFFPPFPQRRQTQRMIRRTSHLPVYYLFGEATDDMLDDHLQDVVTDCLAQLEERLECLVVADLPYQHYVAPFTSLCRAKAPERTFHETRVHRFYDPAQPNEVSAGVLLHGRHCPPSFSLQRPHHLLFLGSPSTKTLEQIALTQPHANVKHFTLMSGKLSLTLE